jgi:hypothetical protein
MDREMRRRNAPDEALSSAAGWEAPHLAAAGLRHAKRLGARPAGPTDTDPVALLTRGLEWPAGPHRWSGILAREALRELGWDVDDMTRTELEDSLPRVHELEFLPPGHEGFWAGWSDSFDGVDPAVWHPFATSSAYFYFIGVNPEEPGDPLVVSVDHEDTGEAPYASGATVSLLLACVERG